MKLEKSNNNAISTNAELIDFYINLGSLYEQKKQWPSAIAHYRLALRINPNLAIAYKKLADLWYKLNRFDKAAEDWYKVLELDIKLITESESIAYYQRSISLSHNSVETYRKLAQVWLQLDKKTEAIASLEKAIALELELEDSADKVFMILIQDLPVSLRKQVLPGLQKRCIQIKCQRK
jgi:tetratricopeptide (TPR) repeat protein